MAGETNVISIRVDADVKKKSEHIMAELGLNMSTAVNMFLRQIARDNAIPLTLSVTKDRALREDLLLSSAERMSGYQGREASKVADKMENAVCEIANGNG